MGQQFLIVTLELILLFLLSGQVTRQIYRVLLVFTRSRSISISLITALLYPGTIIHELSHLFTAEILGVRTGKLTLVPESLDTHDIHAGSVEIAHTDPFRRAIIGLAPFFVGLIALFGLSSMLPNLWTQTIAALQNNMLFSSLSIYLLLLTSYLLFCVSNTMFSSPEDMKGIIPLGITIGIILVAIYFTGLRIVLTDPLASILTQGLTGLVQSLTLVLACNTVIYSIATFILAFNKRRIIF